MIAGGARQYSTKATIIAGHLGHFHGMAHPHGCESHQIPSKNVALMHSAMHNIDVFQAWRVVNGMAVCGRASSLLFDQPTRIVVEPAVERRTQTRMQRRKEAALLVEHCIQKYFPKGLPKRIEQSDIESIQELIIENYDFEYGRSRYALALLWRLMSRLRYRQYVVHLPPRIHVVEPEASPFKKGFPAVYDQACRLRKTFVSYLSQQGKQQHKSGDSVDLSVHCAEVIIASALFGALIQQEHLERLPKALATSCYRLNQQVVVELEFDGKIPYRWVPEGMAYHMICRHSLEGQQIGQKSVKSALVKLLRQLAGLAKNTNPYRYLSTLSDAYWQYHLPGFLYSIACGDLAYTPLPLSTLARIMRKERLVQRLIDSSLVIGNSKRYK